MKLPEIVNTVEISGKVYDFQSLPEEKKTEISLAIQDSMMAIAGYKRQTAWWRPQWTSIIRGIPYDAQDQKALERQEQILEERKATAEVIKLQVEEWLSTVPPRMQRIIRYKVFEGMTWAQVAVRMGRKATADSVRMEFQNFMKAA